MSKNGVQCIGELEIHDSRSFTLQIIVLIMEITIGMYKEGMHMPNNFVEVLSMSFKKCTL